MKNCAICNIDGKYKCPTCLVYYCSVACCKKHREQKCEIATPPPPSNVDDVPKSSTDNQQYFITRDTVRQDKLELLQNDKHLRDILHNPHLRNLLNVIDASNQPEEIMQKAMQEPIFVEFANACLKVVEPEGI